MNDMPQGALTEEEDAVWESGADPAVTYLITVLGDVIGPLGAARREVLFRRTQAGRSIEIRAQVDPANLLAALPELLLAALAQEGPPWPAEEVRRVRWLTRGGAHAARRRGRGHDAPRPRHAPRARRAR